MNERRVGEGRAIQLVEHASEAAEPAPRIGSRFSFRTRLMFGLVAAAVLPVTGFGIALAATQVTGGGLDDNIVRLLLFAIAVAAMLGVILAYLLTADLLQPLRALARAVRDVAAGDLSTRLEVAGEDELASLAESHNRLASDLERRNRELGRILVAIGEASPRDGVTRLVAKAAADARTAFEMIDASIHLGDPQDVPLEDNVPGDPRPVRAILALPDERLGVLTGHLPATRTWERADGDLLELYASEIAVAIRNAQLFEQVEAQTARLLELDAAKDDFLRGVSHNLQTPLTSIRAYAEQLIGDRADRRLTIIVEQAERLSRLVRQLLAVSRIESGALRPRAEVLSPVSHVRRVWEALGASGTEFELIDNARGWLAIADPDQFDQVLWALLDNAIRYGAGEPILTTIERETGDRVRIQITDRGPGINELDRVRLFARYERGGAGSAGASADGGTGLGLYVSRELCRAMRGDLVLEPASAGRGATFTILLPGEAPDEG
jgi:signal transduction histidine kinase